MLKKTLSEVISCFDLLIVFVLFFVIIQLLQDQIVGYIVKNPLFFLVLILINLVIVFLMSGFYGIVYLKLSSKRITIHKFIKSGFKNYFEFFKIGILIAGIIFLVNLFITKIILKYFIDITSVYSFNFLSFVSSKTVSFFVNILFIFSYPLVIIGYFLNKRLNPIKTSFFIVLKKFKKIRFIFFVLFINLILSLIFRMIVSSEFILYRNILISLSTSVFSFVVLIYSYLILLEGILIKLKSK